MAGSTTAARHPKGKKDAALAPANTFLWAFFTSTVGAKVVVR